MKLYCQSCGAVLTVVGSNFLDGDNEWKCSGCGDRYVKPEGYTEEQLLAWLAFPPTPTAA
jgi:hypothetical protein